LVQRKTLNNIMAYCVTLHNMIIEDERGLDLEFFYDNVGSQCATTQKSRSLSSISWDASPNWRFSHTYLAQTWSHRALVRATWQEMMPLHFISFPVICVWGEQLFARNHPLFV
jgi:hypothetical protein